MEEMKHRPFRHLWVFYVFLFVVQDREADGVGAFGVAQHTQEAGVVSAGSAGRGHGEKIRKKSCLLLFALNSFHSLL